MTAVTLADACLRLPELVALAAKGEHVVIMQNGVVLAGLTPPPFQIPTPEEEAARQTRAAAAIRELVESRVEGGAPLPPDSPLWHLLKPESPAA